MENQKTSIYEIDISSKEYKMNLYVKASKDNSIFETSWYETGGSIVRLEENKFINYYNHLLVSDPQDLSTVESKYKSRIFYTFEDAYNDVLNHMFPNMGYVMVGKPYVNVQSTNKFELPRI